MKKLPLACCLALAGGSILPHAGAVDFIRQIQLMSGEAIVHDIPIAHTTGEIRSKPIQGDGSIFQLYAYEDDVFSPFSLVDATVGNAVHANVSLDSHLVDLDVLGIHLDITLGDDPSGSSLPHLLDEKAVGAFIPSAVIGLRSEDPYFPSRTRADQPYAVTVGIGRLPLPDEELPPGAPSKVTLEKSYKLYHPTLHIPSENGSGQGTYPEALEFNLNGTYTIPETYQTLPGNSPTRVTGEETYSAYVRLGEENANARIASATIQIWPVGAAEIQGIEPMKRYQGIPTGVQAALTNLYPDSVTYAQIYKGPPVLGTAGHVIPSSVFSINTFAPQNTVVPLLDLGNGIQEDGFYTIEVLTVTPFNHHQPERVTSMTIEIKRTLTVNSMVSTIE